MAHLPKGQGVFLPPFKAWLASNIPAVYDNTMTYYEELCALIKYLQDVVIPALNHNAEAVTTIATAVEQLQKYVDDYFKNLDVQEEINNKLDEMVESGEFQELVGEYLSWKQDYYEVTNQTESDITEWLDSDREKVILFKNDYTFTSTKSLGANTTLDLNGKVITFNIPSVNDDPTACHGFFNFVTTDEFLGYGGNSNITIKNGKIIGGNLSFCHAKNINIISVDFENCKNNHILEMCAISGLNVENCTFAGIPYGSTGEYIQNDTATSDAFPWFEETNPTYDNTVCRSITVKNCEFNVPEDRNYIFFSGVGTHSGGAGDLLTTKHIEIDNCIFNNPERSSIELWNVLGLNIKDSVFNGEATDEPSIHIRLRSGIVNTNISGCTFRGMVRGIEMAREHLDTKGIVITDCTFENYKSVNYNQYSIITIFNAIQVDVNNCTFRDFTQRAITTTKDEGYDTSVKHIFNINSNLFAPQNDKTGQVISVEAGVCHVLNNHFDMSGMTYGTGGLDRVVRVTPNAEELFYENNLIQNNYLGVRDLYDKPYDSESDTGGFKNVYGSPRTLGTANETSKTFNPTEYLLPSNFNTMIVTLGDGTRTITHKLKDFDYGKKLTPRTWKVYGIDGSDNFSSNSITLNSENQVIYSGSVAIRNVVLLNEM